MTRNLGMGGHESAVMGKDEWLTPPEIIRALGSFELDPCAPVARPWATAIRHFTVDDNGLMLDWCGRVWMNPPYGPHVGIWLAKLAAHGTGTALIFARTETDAWHRYVWPLATSIAFLRGRLCFHHVNGERAQNSAGAPSALIAYGDLDDYALRDAVENKRINARYIRLGM